MSRLPSPTENTLPGPLVTPDASPKHDCSKQAEHLRTKQRRHHTQDRFMPQHSPTTTAADQWPKSAAEFSLKRASTLPPEKSSRRDSSYTPQLSERDSIFATHYLPSDSDAGTPQLPPVKGVDNGQHISVIPKLDDAPVSAIDPPTPKAVSSHRIPIHTSSSSSPMEVDILRNHPFLPASLLTSPDVRKTSFLPSVPSPAGWANQHDADKHSRTHLWDTFQPLRRFASDDTGNKNPLLEDSISESSVHSAGLSDISIPSHRSMILPLDHEFPVLDRETSLHQPRRDSTGDGSRGAKFERSSSRTRRGRVENSIEANLTNAELASHVRSRKSSHYLGLFKENTSSPERKRRDDRGKKHDELSEPLDRHIADTSFGLDHYDQKHPLQPSSTMEEAALHASKSLSHLSLLEAQPVDLVPERQPRQQPGSADEAEPNYKALPPNLLEEIRNFHLTPGGARGSSFSKSIPTQFVEGGQDYVKNAGSFQNLSPSDRLDRGSRRGSGQFEDEEEENEQISSAVYFPHERVTVSDEVDPLRDYEHDEDGVQPFDTPARDEGHVLTPKGHGISNEQEINHVDISLRSKNDNRILHGDLQDLKSPLEHISEQPLPALSERNYESTCESEAASADDSSLSVQEESSLTDDADMTPTATPTQRQAYLRPRRKHRTAAPVGAVELKPYRHQVGGHTTVFRFSRRAVCKQLNNRENEFYERIERRHPEMLMFLARFVTL